MICSYLTSYICSTAVCWDVDGKQHGLLSVAKRDSCIDSAKECVCVCECGCALS